MVAKVLEHPTLVLNRNWQPVNVATVERALVLLWNESARVVDPADYRLYTWADWSELRPDEPEWLVLMVHRDNSRAIHAYERFGFEIIGDNAGDPVERKHDHIVMKLWVGE